ncbi:RHOMBOID-like protein 10, chloroplastic [Malania oleifera]|uniref:RHOMBOID-like protein 10, chloroplastic n=1 Tax=Malania oleifera TaxID=397392 RepID=UPI0025AEBABA|nr:RHOMBOID-like protein 10, chloroplastic [Malania oleifera]
MMASGWGVPQPHRFPISKVGPTPSHLITTAAALRLGHLVRRSITDYHHHHHLQLSRLLCSSFEKIWHLYDVPELKDIWHKRALQFKGINFPLSNDSFSSACSLFLCFFNGEETTESSRDEAPSFKTTSKNLFDGRRWTNILLAINVLVYIAQIATQGKLLLWGAKVNSLIDKGQLWRLATSSFLHANIGHLMVNCYSLNSVGPTMENISGPWRYLAVYFTSAITSSAMSYWFCNAPAVGASGAIFGLVGSVAVFVVRHRRMVGGGKEDLQHIARIIFLNMVIGLLSKGIDNWGHLGGLLGGAATSWFLGPAWRYEPLSSDGQRVVADRAPIFCLNNPKKKLPGGFN